MSDQDNSKLFSKGGEEQVSVPVDTTATLLSMITNERGEQKYKTVEDALKSVAHAQAFIPTLQAENAALKSQAAELEATKAKMAEMEATVQKLLEGTNRAPETTAAPQLDPATVQKLVNETLDNRTASQRAKENQQEVVKAFVDKFGSEAEKQYLAIANELGLNASDMDAMAAKSPKVILKAAGIVQTSATQFKGDVATRSEVNTSAFQPNQETFVQRNRDLPQIGATTEELLSEHRRAKNMVEELHSKGVNVSDLSNPKEYFKYFK